MVNFSLTTVGCHVTVSYQRVPVFLGIDPVLPVSFGISRIQDVLT